MSLALARVWKELQKRATPIYRGCSHPHFPNFRSKHDHWTVLQLPLMGALVFPHWLGNMYHPNFDLVANSPRLTLLHTVMMDFVAGSMMLSEGYPLLPYLTHLYIYALDVSETDDITLVHSLVNLAYELFRDHGMS